MYVENISAISMNDDTISSENLALSKEIEFLVTNIWQRANIAQSVSEPHERVNIRDRF